MEDDYLGIEFTPDIDITGPAEPNRSQSELDSAALASKHLGRRDHFLGLLFRSKKGKMRSGTFDCQQFIPLSRSASTYLPGLIKHTMQCNDANELERMEHTKS